MRWKSETDRIIKRFAIFPIEISREVRWLEPVYIVQQRYLSSSYTGHWRDMCFATKDEYKNYLQSKRRLIIEHE